MGCWGTVIDSIVTSIAEASSFVSFISQWGGDLGSAADHIFLHDWPEYSFRTDRYDPEEIEERYRSFALIRISEENGYSITKALATHTALVHGEIEIQLARLVPYDIRDDMRAVLQQAITVTEPVIYEIVDESEGLIQQVNANGFPWRTAQQDRKTIGDFHGMDYLLQWGHPQGET